MKSVNRSTLIMGAVLAVLLVGGGLTVFATKLGYGTKGTVAMLPTDTVKRGPLTISVTVTGTIRSRQQEIIKSEVEGMPTILYLIPEGTRVKKGDLLCELDASKLDDQKVSQQIVVQNADAAAIGARETLEVTKSQAKSDIAKAELDFQFAKEDVDKYDKGDYPNQLKQAENKIYLAEEERQLASNKADWSEKLFKEKYVSQTDRDADQLALKRANSSVELAEADMKLLQQWTYTRQMTTFKAAVEQADMALDRVKRKAAADIVQAEAARLAKESELERQKAILDKTNLMITKAKMTAPTDGLVVYATTGGGGFRGDREPLAEGSTVRERQEIIYLPTADSVMAAVKVHESALDKVRIGLPVRVTVDAVPNKAFTGSVQKIAPMPDQQSMWQNPDLKVYNTDIWLEGDGSDLRTGMTCRAEIIVDYYPDALYVPVQAIVRVGGKPTAYVPGPDGGLIARPVEIGLDNNRMIRIISGLSAGETVVLAPPLADAAISATERNEQGPPPTGMTFPQTRPSAVPAPNGRDSRSPGEGRRGGASGGAGPGAGQGRRGPDLQNMTEEQRAAMEERRRQFEKMTPEQQQKAREQMRQGRGRGPAAAPASPNQP